MSVCSLSLDHNRNPLKFHMRKVGAGQSKSPRGMESYLGPGNYTGDPFSVHASPVPPSVVLPGSWEPCLNLLSCSSLPWGDTGSLASRGFTQAPGIWQGKGSLAFALSLRPGQHGP